VAGANLVASLQDSGADELRELAQKAVNKLEGKGGAAVVLGSGRGSKALLVAACSHEIVARGLTAPRLLEEAASKIGGGAGGKEILAFAGGPNAGAVRGAIEAIPARLQELLGQT
jgi:alanyl-tRNA synthetase